MVGDELRCGHSRADKLQLIEANLRDLSGKRADRNCGVERARISARNTVPEYRWTGQTICPKPPAAVHVQMKPPKTA
jgi:hypothetical protein